ncbi:MAG TPA: hypothetical protein VFJ43_02370, partial [Bacteroidia bacterium]|nr:hypothetical protein [Bacteroidia bacterium]
MGKLILLPVFSALLFFSCNNPAKIPDKMDSVSDVKHGLSVSNPVDKTPHAVKDSIFNGEHIERYKNGVIYMRGDVQGGLRAGE